MEGLVVSVDLIIRKAIRMDKDEINRLLVRSMTDTISSKEKEVLDNWFASFDILDDYTNGMGREEQCDLGNKILQAIQNEISEKENKPKGISTQLRKTETVAGLVLAVFLFSLFTIVK